MGEGQPYTGNSDGFLSALKKTMDNMKTDLEMIERLAKAHTLELRMDKDKNKERRWLTLRMDCIWRDAHEALKSIGKNPSDPE